MSDTTTPLSVTPDSEQARQFIERMFTDDEIFEFRGFPTDKAKTAPNYQKWFKRAELPELNGQLSRPLFVGINPRADYGLAGNDNVRHCRFVFVDFDPPEGEVVTVEDALKIITDAGLPYPDPIVASGRGVHAYWQLSEPIDGKTFRSIQKRLIQLLGSDPKVCNEERIMRVPGSIHNKGEPVLVELVSCIDERYDLADIERHLPDTTPEAPAAEPLSEGERRPLPNWIAGIVVNGVDKGSDGTPGRNDAAFEIAANLAGNGWDKEDARRHVQTFASNCRPPLDLAEAESCLQSAYSKPREPSRNTDDLHVGSSWQQQAEQGVGTPPPLPQIKPVSLGSLIQLHPKMSRPVIDGVLRSGEVGNIIAASKVGKSWLMYDLLISIATGRQWLDTFNCTAGRVLLIDNELKPETISNRLPKVAKALGVSMADINEAIDVLPLRGKSITLDKLASYIAKIEQGQYQAIVLDAWYRFIPKGSSENDNADVMHLYNLLDQYAEQTGAAIVAVHHASKGQQGDKAVTDVGAGAGSQSRAADAHVVLRQHEEEGHVVLEAAVRSFKPVEPTVLRWDFPVWRRAVGKDAGALKDRKTKREQRQDVDDANGIEAIVNALRSGPLTPKKIREQAVTNGKSMGKTRADRLLETMVGQGLVKYEEITQRGNVTRAYRLAE